METNEGATTRKRRRSKGERAQLVAEYKESGKTQQAFCAEVGIALPTLGLWLKKSRAGRVNEGKLIEVPVAHRTESTIEILLPGAIQLRVPVGTSSEWVRQMVAALRCGG